MKKEYELTSKQVELILAGLAAFKERKLNSISELERIATTYGKNFKFVDGEIVSEVIQGKQEMLFQINSLEGLFTSGKPCDNLLTHEQVKLLYAGLIELKNVKAEELCNRVQSPEDESTSEVIEKKHVLLEIKELQEFLLNTETCSYMEITSLYCR